MLRASGQQVEPRRPIRRGPGQGLRRAGGGLEGPAGAVEIAQAIGGKTGDPARQHGAGTGAFDRGNGERQGPPVVAGSQEPMGYLRGHAILRIGVGKLAKAGPGEPGRRPLIASGAEVASDRPYEIVELPPLRSIEPRRRAAMAPVRRGRRPAAFGKALERRVSRRRRPGGTGGPALEGQGVDSDGLGMIAEANEPGLELGEAGAPAGRVQIALPQHVTQQDVVVERGDEAVRPGPSPRPTGARRCADSVRRRDGTAPCGAPAGRASVSGPAAAPGDGTSAWRPWRRCRAGLPAPRSGPGARAWEPAAAVGRPRPPARRAGPSTPERRPRPARPAARGSASRRVAI